MLRYAPLAALVAFASAQNPTFHARAPLVVVPVSVSDKKHASIDGLTASDFVLLDNGVPRAIEVDPAGIYQSSISVVVVVETSLVAHAALLKVKKTGSMIDGYITGADGEAALVTAGSDVTLRQDFTSDGVHIRNAFQQLHAGGSDQGRMLDACLKGIDLLEARTADRRRILLIVGESKDRGSKATLQEVLARAQRANVIVYALTYSAYVTPFTTRAGDLGPPPDAGVDPSKWVRELSRLAKLNMAQALTASTGGRQLSFETLHAFENDLTSIGKQLHSQYLLSFTPPAEPVSSYHSLQVSVKGHPEAVVRSRPGYWTSGPR